ncbi:MAG: hypothetical protein CR997_09395 [Acidobacteria bacterium]|nr:MAG: hypothetical protein CR997_09395 [Acidobacteriota bacterium]
MLKSTKHITEAGWIFRFVLPFLAISPIFADTTTVGTVIDGQAEYYDELFDIVCRETLSLTGDEFSLSFQQPVSGKWERTTIEKELRKQLSDPDIDIVIALGYIASDQALRISNPSKPLICPLIFDRAYQETKAQPSSNLIQIDTPMLLKRDLTTFYEMTPFTHLAFLCSAHFNPDINRAKAYITSLLDLRSVRVDLIPIGDSSSKLVLPKGTDAVYLAFLPHLSKKNRKKMIGGLNSQSLPVFASMGGEDVPLGALAGYKNERAAQKIARQIALIVQQMLLGVPITSKPMVMSSFEHLLVNMNTAQNISIFPPYSLLTEATLIEAPIPPQTKVWSINEIIDKAVSENLSILVKARELKTGEQEIERAKTHFKPQVHAETLFARIDEDRTSSLLNIPEQQLTQSLTVTQLIYSEDAKADRAIQEQLQLSREEDLSLVRLDIILQTGQAYLKLLKAEAYENIQKENLERSRNHLQLARIRQSTGYSGRSDVYRWESQIAVNRKDVLQADAIKAAARIELNRLMHRSLEEDIMLDRADVSDPQYLTNHALLKKMIRDPWHFRQLRDFLTQEAIAVNPQIKLIDHKLKAQERELLAAERSYWTPTIAFKGEISHKFDKSGAGSNSLTLPPQYANLFSEIDDTSWSAGVAIKLPVLSGGQKLVRNAKARLEVDRIRLLKREVEEKLEAGLRAMLHKAGASYSAIELSKKSAFAAQQNLDLVYDGYSHGVLSVIELLDAQNAALTANLLATNAVYSFLLDYLQVERLTGNFITFSSPQERASWFNRLQHYSESCKNKQQERKYELK